MNVVLYLRYSSDKQNEQSIEGQRRVCEQYCEYNNMTVVNCYIDRALSASKNIDKREAFQKMIKDSEKENFSAVIVYKLDRFARNRYDSAVYKNKLKQHGVRLISATEPISEAPEGILLESLLEGMAEFYSKELAQKVKRGMKETALKGNSCGGKIPLGYKIENKKYTIDTNKAPIVREIFERYVSGEAIINIASDLNIRGYKTNQGGKFTQQLLPKILKNKKYIGTYKYGDIEIEDTIPPIVDKETFEAAQHRLTLKKRIPQDKKANYLLTHKLYCGHCGEKMIGDSGTGQNNEIYRYYSCSAKKHLSTSCNKQSVPKEQLEDVITNDIIEFINNENIEAIADMAIAQAEEENKKIVTSRDFEKEIRATDKSIDNIVQSIEMGNTSPALLKRLEELENRKQKLEEESKAKKENIIILDKKKIMYWLISCRERSRTDENYKQFLINMFIASITIWDEPDGFYRITAIYNLYPHAERNLTFRANDLLHHQKRYGGVR